MRGVTEKQLQGNYWSVRLRKSDSRETIGQYGVTNHDVDECNNFPFKCLRFSVAVYYRALMLIGQGRSLNPIPKFHLNVWGSHFKKQPVSSVFVSHTSIVYGHMLISGNLSGPGGGESK